MSIRTTAVWGKSSEVGVIWLIVPDLLPGNWKRAGPRASSLPNLNINQSSSEKVRKFLDTTILSAGMKITPYNDHEKLLDPRMRNIPDLEAFALIQSIFR